MAPVFNPILAAAGVLQPLGDRKFAAVGLNTIKWGERIDTRKIPWHLYCSCQAQKHIVVPTVSSLYVSATTADLPVPAGGATIGWRVDLSVFPYTNGPGLTLLRDNKSTSTYFNVVMRA